MAEEIKSVRDAANAIASIRSEMRIYAGVAGFVAVIGLGFMGWGFNKGFDKIDRLEELTVRLDTRLEAIEKALEKVAADTGDIRKTVQTASVITLKPSATAFPGWIGAKADGTAKGMNALISGELKDAWIYIPDK